MFIDSGEIVGVFWEEPPLMTNTVTVEKDLAREIYTRLLSQGLRKPKVIFIYPLLSPLKLT